MEREKKGVALAYGGDIPTIIASAKGVLLEKLLEIAKKNNITVYHDPDLAEVLYQLPTGTPIPEELFAAVSEVLAYCYRINADFKSKLIGLGLYNG